VQIRKYRGASKDGIAVKSKILWRNKRGRLGEIEIIVKRQKKAAR
jgi:Holliday junction resolvase-like predicted endonuclease